MSAESFSHDPYFVPASQLGVVIPEKELVSPTGEQEVTLYTRDTPLVEGDCASTKCNPSENEGDEESEEEETTPRGWRSRGEIPSEKEESEEEEIIPRERHPRGETPSSDKIDRGRSANRFIALMNEEGDASPSSSEEGEEQPRQRRMSVANSEEGDVYPTKFTASSNKKEQKEPPIEGHWYKNGNFLTHEETDPSEEIDFLVEKTDALELAARAETKLDENKHLRNDTWSVNTTAFALHDVSVTLDVPVPALTLLDKKKCVVAGGAALYLGCPWSKWTHRCDVDFFVFDTHDAVDIMICVSQILVNEGYVICQSSGSVLTAIGYYGMRRIQIIRSGAKTVDDLISGEHGFDIDAVKAYYDGSVLCASINAEANWRARQCTTYTYRYVEPARLYGMLWKGFALTDEATKHIKNTLGFPPRGGFVAKYENNIVCLNRELPVEVQEYQLNKMQLPVVKNLVETIEAMDCKQNDYIKIFTFAGTYDEYVRITHVDVKSSKLSRPTPTLDNKYSCTPYPGNFYRIRSDYDLRLPLCRVIWKLDFASESKQDCSMGRIEVCDPAEHARLVQLETTLYSDIKDPLVSEFDPTHCRIIDQEGTSMATTNINVKLQSDVKFYINGARVEDPVLLPRTQISVVAFPGYFYDERDRTLPNDHPELYKCKLVWQVKKIFILQRD